MLAPSLFAMGKKLRVCGGGVLNNQTPDFQRVQRAARPADPLHRPSQGRVHAPAPRQAGAMCMADRCVPFPTTEAPL